MPQLQKAMPDAAAPLRKFLRVVMFLSPESRVSHLAGRLPACFLISYGDTLPSRRRKGNDSRNN
jgi:hypothetical protein